MAMMILSDTRQFRVRASFRSEMEIGEKTYFIEARDIQEAAVTARIEVEDDLIRRFDAHTVRITRIEEAD